MQWAIYTPNPERKQKPCRSISPPLFLLQMFKIIEAAYPDELTTISNVITQSEVEEILGNPPTDKAPSPDEIPNRLLR
ncbi:hypothetical protein K3495_g9062 [Podosphaera aphanis]|nr:hypothetical protein K3495_g9062 [Podosphaera aphanis]